VTRLLEEWKVLHVARDFRQGVPRFTTDQAGAWADGAIAGGGRMQVLQGLNGQSENLGDAVSTEEWATIPFAIDPGAPVRRVASG